MQLVSWRFVDYGGSPLLELLEQVANDQRHTRAHQIPLNVWEEDDALLLEASLPGVAPEDLEVSCTDSTLTIRASSSVPARDYLHQEFFGLDYERQVTLPQDCRPEDTEAQVEQGVLTVRIPKRRSPAPKPIRIQVNRKGPQPTTIEAEPGQGYQVIRGAAHRGGARTARPPQQPPSEP